MALGGVFGGVRVRRADGDDEFARIGEMLLIHFEPLDGGDARGQQVEHVDVEMQPGQPQRQSE